MRPGPLGPCYDVRTCVLKPDGFTPTVELWRKAVTLLAAMTSLIGAVTRFMHVWPYKTYDVRTRHGARQRTWPSQTAPRASVKAAVLEGNAFFREEKTLERVGLILLAGVLAFAFAPYFYALAVFRMLSGRGGTSP